MKGRLPNVLSPRKKSINRSSNKLIPRQSLQFICIYYEFQKDMKPMRIYNLTLSDGIKTVQKKSRTEFNRTQRRWCGLHLCMYIVHINDTLRI